MIEPTSNTALRRAIRDMAREAAPGLLAEAFDDAYDEARSILRRLMLDALLEEAGGLSDGKRGSEAGPKPYRDQAVAETRSVPAGIYVYGFARGAGDEATTPRGVSGLPTSTVRHDQVAAIVSEAYGSPAAWGGGEGGTPDLAEIGARAQEHERVLQAVLESGPVIPMRFGTVYPSRDAVLETLHAHYPAIDAALEAVDGKAEWGLTVTSKRNQRDLAPSGMGSRRGGEATGRAYLNRREAEKVAAEQAASERREVATHLHRAIEEAAAGSVVHPARRAIAPDRDTDILLRASYLVDNAVSEQFKAAIVDALETAGDLGITGELTGPWPPYNFSRLQLDGATA
jgi:hypothetical protein